jgi:hypothetical protein
VVPPTPPPKPKADFTPKRADHPEDASVHWGNSNYPAHKKMTNDMLDSLGRANAVEAHKRHISGDNTITFNYNGKDEQHKIMPLHEINPTFDVGFEEHIQNLSDIFSGNIYRDADVAPGAGEGFRKGDPREEIVDFIKDHIGMGSKGTRSNALAALNLRGKGVADVNAFLNTGSAKEMKSRFDRGMSMTPESIASELESKYGPDVLKELGANDKDHKKLAAAHAFMGANEDLAKNAHPVSYNLAKKFPQLAKMSVDALMRPMAEKFAKVQHQVKDLSPFSKKDVDAVKTAGDFEKLFSSTPDRKVREHVAKEFSSIYNLPNLNKLAFERTGSNYDYTANIPNVQEVMKGLSDELKMRAIEHVKSLYGSGVNAVDLYKRPDHEKRLLDVQIGETSGKGSFANLKPTEGYKNLTKEASSFVDSISEIPVHDVVMFNRKDALINGLDPNLKNDTRACAASRISQIGGPSSMVAMTDTSEYWKAYRPAVFVPEASVAQQKFKYSKELSESDAKATMVHELAHIIEGNDKYVTDMAQMFLAHRVRGEKSVKLNSVIKGAKYDDTEMGRKDNFDKTFDLNQSYYIGKDYGKHASEVLSMGMEQLYANPKNFIEKDPEYAHFVISVLQYKTAHEALRKASK